MLRLMLCVFMCAVAACDVTASNPGMDAGSGPASDAAIRDAAMSDAGSDAALRADGATPSDAAISSDARMPDASGDKDSGPVDDPRDHDLSALCLDCAADEKVCAGLCVSSRSPAHGCSASACTACSFPHAAAACGAQGACTIGSCEPGWADCDQNAANGCEADLSEPAHCGACGVACAGPSALCGPTGCAASCDPPLTQCGTRCVDLLSSTTACGSCSTTCSNGDAPNEGGFPSCALAKCSKRCSDGFTLCGDRCVDLSRTGSDCGSCGHGCTSEQVCVSSACAPRPCQSGWKSCDGLCVTPQVDPMNCGRCGHACGAEESCVSGSCVSTSAQWVQSGLKDPLDLIVDAERLYWIERGEADGKVVTGSTRGGSRKELATGQRRPMGLVVDERYVYWSNNLGAAVMRAPKDGSAPASMVTAATSPEVIAVDASYLYLAHAGGLDRVAKSGGTPQAFATIPSMPSPAVLKMLVEGQALYVLTQYERSWRVWHIDAMGAVRQVYANDATSVLPILTTDSAHLYVAHFYDYRNFQGIAQIDKANGDFHSPFISTTIRGLPRPLIMSAFVMADCGAFWTDGLVLYLGRNGRPDHAALARGEVRALALDDASIYWTDGSGAIGKVPRP